MYGEDDRLSDDDGGLNEGHPGGIYTKTFRSAPQSTCGFGRSQVASAPSMSAISHGLFAVVFFSSFSEVGREREGLNRDACRDVSVNPSRLK